MIANPLVTAANDTHVSHHLSTINIGLLCESNQRRRGGLIINKSRYNLHLFFGRNPPKQKHDWLEIPYLANIDVPFHFIGKIWGYWEVTDDSGATIHEFYGDFN